MSLSASLATASASPNSAAIAGAVRDLDADHDRATAAIYLLQAGGEKAARQIRDAWTSLSLLGQRRAIGALSRLARDHDPAVVALIGAARSENEEIRSLALTALERGEARGREGLVVLVVDPLVGDRAASSLARMDPRGAVVPILSAMERPGGADRPGLRSALAAAVRRSGDEAEGPIREWLVASPDPAAVASAAVGLCSFDELRDLLVSLIEYAAPKATDFPTTWRLLHSATTAGPSDGIDAWVRSQLDGPEEWMLRQAAVDTITARGHREEARPSLGDSYPRVRGRAAIALSGDAQSLVERATLARRDTWPMVRADAVRSLRTEAEAIPVIVASVDDSMSLVRATAIEALAASSHDEGWERVHQRLRAGHEWPEVTAAAIDYVVAHCRATAVDGLLRIVSRASPSTAGTEDLNNAARAVEALRMLHTPEADAAVEHLRHTEQVPPTLKMALDQPLAEDGRCPRLGR